MRSLLLLLLLSPLFCFAQVVDPSLGSTYSPAGKFDYVYNKEGKQYSLREVTVNPQILLPCNAGYFNLYYEPGSGMDGNTQAEIDRRAVLCQLFSDISDFISPPANSPLANGNIFVNVHVVDLATLNLPNAAAAASGFYSVPQGTAAGVGGIADNQMWITINSGVDGYTNVASPVASNNFYHMEVGFNFNAPLTWNTSLLTLATGSDLDMYTVALHEVTHALGFASLIDANGDSRIRDLTNNMLPYFSRFDSRLQSSTGSPLIVSSNACSNMYDYAWNYTNLPSPQNTLSPNLSNCVTDNTTCATAIRYVSPALNGQHIYTPNCFETGSSLSHFEDQCSPTPLGNSTTNNDYFVMSERNNPGLAGNKRHLTPEERIALCDLGYHVAGTYGNNSVVQNSFFNYGASCNGDQVVGINDGISPTGVYQNVTQANTLITINAVDGNDFFAAGNQRGIECVEDLYFVGSTISVSGTSIDYTPPVGSFGITVLRYIPVDLTTGVRGNITYIYVVISNPNCVGTVCNPISNGGFEGVTNTQFPNNVCGGTSPVFSIDCWNTFTESPDVYNRVCTGTYGVPGGFCNPVADVWNAPSTTNNIYIGLAGRNTGLSQVLEESMQTQLAAPLLPGGVYTIDFYARVTDDGTFQNIPANMLICGSNAMLASGGNEIDPATNTNLIPLDQPLIANNGQWNHYVVTFQCTSTVALNFIYIAYDASQFVSPGPPSFRYVLIDDFSLIPQSSPTQVTASPASVCFGNTSTLTATGGVSYVWNGGALVNATGSTQTVSPPATTNYTVVGTDINGCTSTGTITVTVNNSSLQVSSSAIPSTVCSGQQSTISATVTVGNPGFTYLWQPGNLTGSSNNVNPVGTTTYSVTATDASGCSGSSAVTVTVAPSPTVSVTASNPSVCPGSSTSLTASGATTYIWNPGNLAGSVVTVSPSSTTTYTVTGTDICSSTATITINILPTPTISIVASPTVICTSGSSTLTASGAVSFIWQPGNLTGSSVSVSPTVTTTYTVTGTGVNGCTATQTITLAVSSPSVTAVASPSLIVPPASSTLTASGASSYVWQPGNLTGSSVSVSPSTTTTYTVTGTDALGCTATAIVTVTVVQPCGPCTGGSLPAMITSSVNYSGNVCVNNDVVIDGPATVVTITNANVRVAGFNGTNMRIHVRNGARLNIVNSNVFSCNNNLWEGIYIDDNASQVVTFGSLIEDAYHAIVSVNGGMYTCINTTFNKNYKSIEVAPYAGNHPGTIRGCTFTAVSTPLTSGSATTLKIPFATRPPAVGVEINNVQNITVGFNAPNGSNLFTRLERGVHVTSKSNLTLINNEFRQIRYSTYCSSNPCPNTGIAVLVENSSTLTAGGSTAVANTFRNCDNGIHTRNDVNCDIQYNTFLNIDAPAIYSSRCIYLTTNTLQTMTVNNNSFTDFRQGVEVQTYDKCFVFINNNEFKRFNNGQGILCRQNNKSSLQIYTNLFNNNNPNDFGLTGISVGNAVITTNGLVDIQGNTIRNCANGIEVTSITAPQITNQNNIRFKFIGAPSFTEYGIHITNCPKSLVDNNTVFRTGNSVPGPQYANLLVGIAVDMGCISSQISNNLVLRLATGLRFSGSNNLPLVVSCNQMATNRVGMQLNSTAIGNQGNSAQSQDNQWLIPSGNGIWGVERVNSAQPTFYQRSNPVANPWFPLPTQMNPPNALQDLYVNNSPYNCTIGCPNPPCQQNQVAKIASGQAPYDQPLSSLDRYFTIRNAYGTVKDNPGLMTLGTSDDAIVIYFHDSLMLTNIGLMRMVSDSLAEGDTLVPRMLYNNFLPTNTPEQNQKIVYEIYFRTWAVRIYEFSQQDYNTLLSVAQQYPDDGGTAVLDARVMINYRQDDYFGNVSARVSGQQETVGVNGIMYPNPAKDLVTYDIFLSDSTTGEIQIWDIFGRQMSTKLLYSGQNSVAFNVGTFASGLYVYRVYVEGELKESDVFIINK